MSTLLAFFVFVCLLALEIVVASAVTPSNVGWDPVSLWHQSTRGKVFVVLVAALPILIPLLISIVVFVYAYRRLSRALISPPPMQNSLRQ